MQQQDVPEPTEAAAPAGLALETPSDSQSEPATQMDITTKSSQSAVSTPAAAITTPCTSPETPPSIRDDGLHTVDHSSAHQSTSSNTTHSPAPGTASGSPNGVIISLEPTATPTKSDLDDANMRKPSSQPPPIKNKRHGQHWSEASFVPSIKRLKLNDASDGDEDMEMQTSDEDDTQVEEVTMDDDEELSQDDTPIEEMSEEERAMLYVFT